jgi:hypothetical protein
MPKANDRNEAARPTQDAIAKRAYELSLQRGSVPGYELDDWLQAEAELTAAAAAETEDRSGPDADGPGETASDETDAPASRSRAEGRRAPARDRAGSRRSLRT